WDPRGFENTKWHHMDCFFPLDADLVSAEAIEGFSELKVNLTNWDPRGYENTKWYHVGCFFPRDEGLASAEIFEGFSDLKSSDQEKLKKLVTGVDYETDEDEEAAQEKKNATKEKIIVEYAKSGRSSCKKCSEKIESKSLRLGFSSWDPRGFENTKWHHMDCFFPLDADLVSAEAIEGFSELKSSDQEKLKKLVTEGGQSSKKVL
nr:polynucleotide 3'-phosphatase ZDP isoform X1 [Tanacetum cinerariifolium]